MSTLVVANDVIPGFGVPVAAPGIRAAGIIEGLRRHGHDVHATVPRPILEKVWTRPSPPTPPPATTVLDPTDLAAFIGGRRFDQVVFTNANMAAHLEPGPRYVFDMFAPKILELLSSNRPDRDWAREAAKKERAFALADHVWVNGHRKIGYALGWLLRPSVERVRTEQFAKPRLVDGDPMEHLTVVEMAVPLPAGIEVRGDHPAGGRLRVGVAGYAQRWSTEQDVSPAERIPVALGHDVHVLAPHHWGGTAPDRRSASADGVTVHAGPLDYGAFGRWIQSMDVIADAYRQTAERTMAMITRTVVALRLGVPVIHGCDSEVSDLIAAYDAGWVVDPDDEAAWKQALEEATDPTVLRTKQRGAARLSADRFDPAAALAAAA